MPSNVLHGFSLPFTGRYSALSPTPARDSRNIVKQRVFIFLSFTHSNRSHFLTQNAEYAAKLFTNIVLESPYSLLASWFPVSIGAETSSKKLKGEDKKTDAVFFR
jgi:hypothetical protein